MKCSLYLSSVEKFWPTPLYKASMYIDSAFFFTQQLLFTLALDPKDIASGTRPFSPF
jgi:hypothetical protein